MGDYRLQQLDLLIDLHNNARANRWVWKSQPLNKNIALMSYAQKWSNKMAVQDKLYHSSLREILGLGFSRAGENIAYGQKTPESVMKSWMRSPGHKSNILNNNFTQIGCGMSLSGNGRVYWCVCFGK